MYTYMYIHVYGHGESLKVRFAVYLHKQDISASHMPLSYDTVVCTYIHVVMIHIYIYIYIYKCNGVVSAFLPHYSPSRASRGMTTSILRMRCV